MSGFISGKLRDVLFTPWRAKYVKRDRPESEMESQCVFCSAVKAGPSPESLVLFKGKFNSVILNKFPYNNGHAMIIPNDHLQELTQLPEPAFLEIHELLRTTYIILKAVYAPGGLNIGMNVGKTGGAGIAEHLHYHLVPRWDGDSNFMPIIAGTKVVSESLSETYSKLEPHFKKVSS